MRSWLGYLFGGFLVVFACTVAALALTSAISTMEGMQRVVMPGRAALTLPAGPSTLYIETHSKVGDRVIETAGDPRVSCKLVGLELKQPGSTVKYSLAGYLGHNAFDIDVGSGGRYDLECSAEREVVIAVGSGVGSWFVIAVLAVIPLLGGLALMIVTYLRRRRARSSATTPT